MVCASSPTIWTRAFRPVHGRDDHAVERRVDGLAPPVVVASAPAEQGPRRALPGCRRSPAVVGPDEVEGVALSEHVGAMAGNPVCGRPHGDPLASQRELDDHGVGCRSHCQLQSRGASDLDLGGHAHERRQPVPRRAHRGRHRGRLPRGIGRATADRLARDGWSIALLDLDGEAAEARPPRSAATGRWLARRRRRDVAARTRSRRPSPRSQPAAGHRPGQRGRGQLPVDLDVTLAEWDRIFDINMRGAFLVTRRVVPAMLAAGVGRIVSVSSASAQRGGGTSKVPYSASKAALIGFSRALARELGPRGI